MVVARNALRWVPLLALFVSACDLNPGTEEPGANSPASPGQVEGAGGATTSGPAPAGSGATGADFTADSGAVAPGDPRTSPDGGANADAGDAGSDATPDAH